MVPLTTTNGNRARSLSGASALLGRRFTRCSSTAPRPTLSKSESTTPKRRATLDATTSNQQSAHIRIVPNIENPSRSLIFDIVDRELEVGSVIKMGRYSERFTVTDCMSFKSKVVSRCHCEVWTESDGKVYIRDTKSSSGTFLNHVRLSPAGSESRAVQLNDGDIVQLGVDFQGGREEMYRSVKMKFELNRSRRARPLSFSLNAFQNLRNLRNTPLKPENEQVRDTQPDQQMTAHCMNDDNTTDRAPDIHASVPNHEAVTHSEDLEECCICLYALAPFQALFVSPCSHTYHYKCIRPLLKSYPGFQCPICRTYSDLEASVAIEADEVMEKYGNQRQNNATAPPADSGSDLQSPQDQVLVDEPEELIEQPIAPQQSTPNSSSENLPDSNAIAYDHQVALMITGSPQPPRRERRSSQFMEKLKMVFFEKRKSSSAAVQQQQAKQRKHNNTNRPRPLSYPNLLSSAENETPPLPVLSTSTSSGIHENPSTSLQFEPSLSRQTTSHLIEMITNYQTEPMVADN